MKFKKLGNFYILNIFRNEKIKTAIEKFCQKENIKSGFFVGLGAIKNANLAFYNINQKKYYSRKFKKVFELTNIVGNISFFKNNMIIHSHITLADNKFKVIGGHLIDAEVSGVCEICFWPSRVKIRRKYDPVTGLNILKF